MPTNSTENIYSTEFENDPNPIPSSKVGYDNTESGLEATTVQGAIDELDSKIKASDEASEITYDNTESGLEATHVQGAIDELTGNLADAVEDLSNIGYQLTGRTKFVKVTATGLEQALKDALTALNTLIAELPENKYIKPIYLDGTAIGGTFIRPSYYNTIAGKNNTYSAISSFAIIKRTQSEITLRSVNFSSSDVFAKDAIVNTTNGTISITDNISDHTADECTVSIVYEEYVKGTS